MTTEPVTKIVHNDVTVANLYLYLILQSMFKRCGTTETFSQLRDLYLSHKNFFQKLLLHFGNPQKLFNTLWHCGVWFIVYNKILNNNLFYINGVQIRFTNVYSFIQLLHVLHTNLITFVDSDFVHSFSFVHSKVKSGAVKFLFNSNTEILPTHTLKD